MAEVAAVDEPTSGSYNAEWLAFLLRSVSVFGRGRYTILPACCAIERIPAIFKALTNQWWQSTASAERAVNNAWNAQIHCDLSAVRRWGVWLKWPNQDTESPPASRLNRWNGLAGLSECSRPGPCLPEIATDQPEIVQISSQQKCWACVLNLLNVVLSLKLLQVTCCLYNSGICLMRMSLSLLLLHCNVNAKGPKLLTQWNTSWKAMNMATVKLRWKRQLETNVHAKTHIHLVFLQYSGRPSPAAVPWDVVSVSMSRSRDGLEMHQRLRLVSTKLQRLGLRRLTSRSRLSLCYFWVWVNKSLCLK